MEPVGMEEADLYREACRGLGLGPVVGLVEALQGGGPQDIVLSELVMMPPATRVSGFDRRALLA